MNSMFKVAVEKALTEMGKDRAYLSEIIGMNYQTLSGKFQRDSFDEESIFYIAYKLKIDLNKIRDEAFLYTGVIALWRDEYPDDVTAFRIDGDFYSSRGICISDIEESFNTAIEVSVNELFIARENIKYTLTKNEVRRLRSSGFYITIKINEVDYAISLSDDKSKGGIKINIDEAFIKPHKDFFYAVVQNKEIENTNDKIVYDNNWIIDEKDVDGNTVVSAYTRDKKLYLKKNSAGDGFDLENHKDVEGREVISIINTIKAKKIDTAIKKANTILSK